jgi:putative transcriptional regulator
MSTPEKPFSLRNHFLLATPTLAESNLAETVTYVFEHSDKGAMGIVVNRPLGLTLRDVFKQLNIDVHTESLSFPVFGGGKTETERGFVIHATDTRQPAPRWESSVNMEGGISITTSKDILEAIAKNEGPEDFLVALGYFSWSAGQLEAELVDNAWVHTPANADVLFHTPYEQRLDSAARLLGIDIRLMSTDVGHA